jgi:hypothetical protein
LIRRAGSKEKIRRFLLKNVGRVIESNEIQAASGGVAEFGRRLRELREREGWQILTHNDRSDLKPGQYLIPEKPPRSSAVAFTRGISLKLRAQVFDRNGFTCQMCGRSPGETDPETGRKVRLHVGHIVDKSFGGKDELSNLRTLCSSCNQGAKNITQEKPTKIWLLGQVRKAGADEQRAVYEWLRSKFNG